MIQSCNTRSAEPSIAHLFRDLTDETRTLMRQEIELAKAEMSEKAAKAGRNIAYMAIGGLVGYAGFLILLFAASIGLIALLNNVMDSDIAGWLGPAIVGAVASIVGYVLIQKGFSTLRRESFMPQQTIDSLRENKEWITDHITTPENRMSPVNQPRAQHPAATIR